MSIMLKYCKNLFLILGLCFAIMPVSIAQVDSVFWFAVPEVTDTHGDRPIFMRILTYDEPVTCTLLMPAEPAFTPINLTLAANSANLVDITYAIDLLENSIPDSPQNKGFQIIANGPVSAVYEIKNLANPDIFVLKGRNALGTTFFTPFQTDAVNGGGFAFNSFDIVATENNTLVTITPSKDITGHIANVPFSIILQKGQTYSARATGINANQHLNGSKIVSNKNIAVTVKDDTMIGAAWGFCADLGGDQIVPVQHINTEYILIKGFLNIKDKAYIIAPYNNTNIYIDGNPVPVATLQSGQTFSLDITQPYTYIRTSNAAYVMHLSGFGCEMSCPILPALKSSCEQRVAFTRYFSDSFYAMLITKQGNEDGFKLNGINGIITPGMFTTVPGTNNEWVAARVDLGPFVTPETYNFMTNDSGDFIMGVINGGTGRSVYGYLTNFSQIDLGPDILKCANVPAILDPGPRNQYLWSTGDTTQTLAVYEAGTYWVEVTTNECVMYDTIQIFNKPDLSFELGSDTSYCNNTPYPLQVNPVYTSYLWSTGNNTPALTATQTGKYWLRTTDNVGCTYTDTISLHINNFHTIHADTMCFGDSIQLYASPALTWTWSPAASFTDPGLQTPKVSPPVSTMYYVEASFPGNTATDPPLLCYDSSYILVVQHIEDNFKDTIVCFSPFLLLNPPSGYDQYLWSTGATSQSLQAATTNLYWVKMTDTLGCFAIDSAHITIIPDLNLNITSGKNPLCIGETTTLTVTSGYPSATYLWNTNETGSSILIQPTLTTPFQVVGTQDGCKDSLSINIVVNPLPNIEILAANDSICLNDSLLLMTSGGSTYTWAAPILNQNSTNWVKPQSTTVYSVTGTDLNGCKNNASYTVIVVPLPLVTATVSPGIVCAGESVSYEANGASSYFWVPMGTNLSSFTEIPLSSFSGYLLGMNDFGCINTDSFDIVVKPVPHISITAPEDTICLNDSVLLTANSSLANTTFYWSTTSTNTAIYVSPTVPTKYVLSGTMNGCHSADSIMIGVLPLPNVQITTPSVSICEGQNTTLTATGAFSWLWQPSGAVTSSITFQPPANISGFVKGTGLNGCSDTANFNVIVKPMPWITMNPTADTTCSGDTITLQCSSVVPGATFNWSIPAIGSSVQVHPLTSTSYSVTSLLNGCSDTKNIAIHVFALPSTQISFPNDSVCSGDSIQLTAGGAASYAWGAPLNTTQNPLYIKPSATTTYQVTGTDLHGCKKKKTQTITVVPLPPLTASVTPDTICPGEQVTFQASGANSYLWLPYSTNSASFQQSPSYSLNVYLSASNSFGCLKKDTFHIYVKPVPQLTVSAQNDTICRRDTMQLTAQSNLSGTSFLWSTTATTASINVFPQNTTYYTVTGTKNNCSSQAGYNLVVLTLPTVNAYANPDSVCSGANVNLSATGALSYIWTPGNYTTSGVTVNPVNSTNYIVTGTYSNGCKNKDTVAVLVSPKPSLTVTSVPSEICSGSGVNLNVVSNLPSTQFNWFNANTNSSQNYIPSTSGYFTVSGNYNGCIGKDSVLVTVHPNPSVSITFNKDTLCQHDTVFLYGSGASVYSWQPVNQIVQDIWDIPLVSTTYVLTGTDGNLCSDKDSVFIFVYPPVNMSITASDDTICQGDSITLTSSGAATSSWLPFLVNGNTVHVAPGFSMPVTLIGTDVNGCTGGDFIDIVVKPTPQLAIIQSADSVCRGDSVMLTVSSDMSGLPFTWSTGIIADTIYETPIITTWYYVSCTFDGCTGTDSTEMPVVQPPLITITPANPELCQSDTLNLLALSSSALTTYQWSTGSLTDSTQLIPNQSTTVFLSTQTGICPVKDSVFVLVNEIPQISFIPEDPWICAGDSIFLIASVLPVGSTLIWNTGNTAPGHYLSPEQTTYYRVNALNHNCKNTDSVDVRVNYHPQISLGPDQTLCNGEELTLEVKGLADEYFWSNGSSLPTTQITQSGLYYIVATLDSCISTDTIIIVSCSEIWIPNAFTPDGDNLNDFFKPECLNISEFHMVIYDRWGTLVFESNQCNEGWDGKFKGEIAPFGIYSYVIEFREIKEYVLPGMQLRKGFLMLLK